MMEIEEKGSIAQEEEEGEEEDGVSCLAAKRMKLMPPSPFEGRVETERDQVCVCVCWLTACHKCLCGAGSLCFKKYY